MMTLPKSSETVLQNGTPSMGGFYKAGPPAWGAGTRVLLKPEEPDDDFS
jgi:hypothetical protein